MSDPKRRTSRSQGARPDYSSAIRNLFGSSPETPIRKAIREDVETPTATKLQRIRPGGTAPKASLRTAAKPRGVLTGLARDAVYGANRLLGSSERDAAQSASRFEDWSHDWNPLSAADAVGTQLRRLADDDRDFDSSALAHGALGTALTVAPELAGPALKAFAKTGTGKKIVGALSRGGIEAPTGAELAEMATLDLKPTSVSTARIPKRSTPDVRTAEGAVVTPRQRQPGVLSSPGKARPLTDEKVQLQHFSHQPALSETSPASFGSNPNRGFLSREERATASANPRTYFGVNGGYVREGPAGPFEYGAELPSSRLVTVGTPQHDAIRDAAREIIDRGDKRFGKVGPDGSVLMDSLVKGAGYAGVRFPETSIGDIAQVFEPLPVNRITPTVPDDFLPANIQNAMARNDWTIATGANPMGQSLPDADNIARNKLFQASADSLGAKTYPVAGKYGNEEQSFLVAPIGQEEAVQLGTTFDQDSVLTNRGLLMHDGSLVPAKGVQTFSQEPEDFFSTMAVPGHKDPTRFAVDLGDFNRVPDPTRKPPEGQPPVPQVADLTSRGLRALNRIDEDAQGYFRGPKSR